MGKLIVDKELQSKLNGLNSELEVCDGSGKTLGRFLPEESYRKLCYAAVIAACPFSDEELARRRQETGGLSLPEILKSLERA